MGFDHGHLHRPGSAPPNLSFDRQNKFFDFGDEDDFFGPLGPYDDTLSPTECLKTHGRPSQDKLPSRVTPAPSNQLTHEDMDHENRDQLSHNYGMREFANSNQHEAVKARTGTVSDARRKNSIEMFLSQSPSRALGDDFLRLHLDEASPGGQFSISSGPEASSKYALSSEMEMRYQHRFVAPPPPPLHHDPNAVIRQQNATAMSPMESYDRSAHQDDSWDVHGGSYSASHHQARSVRPETQTMGSHAPPVHSYQREYYSGMTPPDQYASAYGSTQWDISNGSPVPGHMAPMNMNRAVYPPSGQAFHPSHGRVNPPITRGSRDGLSSGSHQPYDAGSKTFFSKRPCKFFLQGHCRLGNKCKFAHPVSNYPRHMMGQDYASGSPMLGPGHVVSSPVFTPMPPVMGAPQRSPSAPTSTGRATFAPRPTYRVQQQPVQANSQRNVPSNSPPLRGSYEANRLADLPARPTPGVGAVVTVEDIQGRVYAMSKDQNGCRLLQEQLDHTDREDLHQIIFSESLEHLKEMMMDPFGNYLFQKLLERVSAQKQLQIVENVRSNLVTAALNLHGTRSVQKVVEVSSLAKEVAVYDQQGNEVRRVNLPAMIVNALQHDAVRLCVDSNGNHVIQRALQYLDSKYNQFVFDAVCRECMTVGTHRHGCCVLQRCFDAANAEQKRALIQQVERHAMELMQDPYGNYVVQYVLDSCEAGEAHGLLLKPLGQIYELSVQKFSSNVVEKCLERSTDDARQYYVDEIASSPHLSKMIQDQFANYVVQRALSVCLEEQCMQLVHAIRPHLVYIKNTSGGRRITARILKRFPNMDLALGPPGSADGSINEPLEMLSGRGDEEGSAKKAGLY